MPPARVPLTKPKKYRNVPDDLFCGKAAGSHQWGYPVNTPGRCSAALSYGARFAPDPEGLARCVLRKARQQGFACGGSSQLVADLNLKPAPGVKTD